MNTNSQLPAAASKKEMYNKLNVFAISLVRNEMNDVIKTIRRCSLKEAKDTKRLRPTEVAQILKRFE